MDKRLSWKGSLEVTANSLAIEAHYQLSCPVPSVRLTAAQPLVSLRLSYLDVTDILKVPSVTSQ